MNNLVGGNPLAPEWMQGSYDCAEVPAGYFPIAWRYATTLSAANNAMTSNNLVPIDTDADFLLQSLSFNNLVGSAGLTVRFRVNDGRSLMPDGSLLGGIAGNVYPAIRVPAGGQIIIDGYNDASGTLQTMQVVFTGVKLYRIDPAAPPPLVAAPRPYTPLVRQYSQPPAGWRDVRFDIPLSQTAMVSGLVYTVTVSLDTDADWYWRGWHQADGILFRIIDPMGRYLTGGDAGGVVGDSVDYGNPLPIFPEVMVPAGGAYTFQVTYSGGGTGIFKPLLCGVKRYRNV